eukprot:CAMPEP_0115880476 /NCGR_PEP_ID=MMETSP0287-20121206/27898_1 /TAXON_ID=412157 /ORGANISM="Chrysochromulina rotalis, Strain UIO044" /LENGTH=33 /DNA_ID= /DNA_START= /DNA_END= /DNA_ORIENTATION=
MSHVAVRSRWSVASMAAFVAAVQPRAGLVREIG